MKITQIKKIGKGQRFSLFLDDEFVCSLESEIIVKNHLALGLDIDENQLEKIKKQNSDLTCFEKSLSIIERSLKSEKNLRKALVERGYFKESIDKAVAKLKEYGYIDDEIFCECFIRSNQFSKGKKRIKFELLQKGISQDIIENKIEEMIIEENEEENCFVLLKKYLKNRIFDAKTKQKAYNHLLTKGFSYNTIKKSFDRWVVECQDDD